MLSCVTAETVHPYPPGGLLEQALDLLFPPVCIGCRRVGRWICRECWELTQWLTIQACRRCGIPSSTPSCLRCTTPTHPCDTLLAVARFEGVAREAVHVLKYEGRHAISGLLGRLMAATVEVPVDAVVPVSLHRRRRRERGYDQAEMLARRIARARTVPLRRDAIERTRYTAQQVTLNGDARHENVAGAFRSRHRWNGQTILLVDDVSTTGATMGAAAGVLKEAGAGQVIGLVFARTEEPPAATSRRGP